MNSVFFHRETIKEKTHNSSEIESTPK